eukprot:COSAG02_NODE_134_length_34593_cov_43.594886_24_plen_74_part_00
MLEIGVAAGCGLGVGQGALEEKSFSVGRVRLWALRQSLRGARLWLGVCWCGCYLRCRCGSWTDNVDLVCERGG